MKGDYHCRCECCSYWRRRVHRVAADADKRTGRVRKQLSEARFQADVARGMHRHACKSVARLRAVIGLVRASWWGARLVRRAEAEAWRLTA